MLGSQIALRNIGGKVKIAKFVATLTAFSTFLTENLGGVRKHENVNKTSNFRARCVLQRYSRSFSQYSSLTICLSVLISQAGSGNPLNKILSNQGILLYRWCARQRCARSCFVPRIGLLEPWQSCCQLVQYVDRKVQVHVGMDFLCPTWSAHSFITFHVLMEMHTIQLASTALKDRVLFPPFLYWACHFAVSNWITELRKCTWVWHCVLPRRTSHYNAGLSGRAGTWTPLSFKTHSKSLRSCSLLLLASNFNRSHPFPAVVST